MAAADTAGMPGPGEEDPAADTATALQSDRIRTSNAFFGEPRAINPSHPRGVWLHHRPAARRARRFGLLAAIIWTAARAQTAQPVRHFDIPAQALAPALTAFARQADVTLLSSASAVAGLRAPGVRGDFTVAQALGLLLKGTGLSFQQVSRSAIAIVTAAQTRFPGHAAGAATVSGGSRARESAVRRPARASAWPPWGILRPEPDRLAQVLIQSRKYPGEIRVEASKHGWQGPDLRPATLAIQSDPVASRPHVP